MVLNLNVVVVVGTNNEIHKRGRDFTNGYYMYEVMEWDVDDTLEAGGRIVARLLYTPRYLTRIHIACNIITSETRHRLYYG